MRAASGFALSPRYARRTVWKLLCSARKLQLVPVVLASALAVALLVARMLYAQNRSFSFLTWNLFLAWVPWLIAALCAHVRGVRLSLAVGLWLLFFPNAPYLVTDFVHLKPRAPVPLWFDVGLLAAFAWAGLLLAVTSLSVVHQRVELAVGRGPGWIFVVLVSGLSGFGIYIGRFLRKNSWDALLEPWELARAAAAPIFDPFSHPRAWAVAALFGVLTLVVYSAWAKRAERVVRGSA